MSIAPSEKHLEDWIVANPNLFGELEEYAEFGWEKDSVSDYGGAPIDDEYFTFPFFTRIIGRQVQFPCGRADLVTTTERSMQAIELKAGAIDSKTVSQCLRYMHEIERVFEELLDIIGSTPARSLYTYPTLGESLGLEYPQREVMGIVVGATIGDPNLTLVCNLTGIQIVTYDYESATGAYTFTLHSSYGVAGSHDDYRNLVNSRIGLELRQIMLNRADAHDKENINTAVRAKERARIGVIQ